MGGYFQKCNVTGQVDVVIIFVHKLFFGVVNGFAVLIACFIDHPHGHSKIRNPENLTADFSHEIRRLHYSWAQWAAVRIQLVEISEPPHMYEPSKVRSTCHGNCPLVAFLPPTIWSSKFKIVIPALAKTKIVCLIWLFNSLKKQLMQGIYMVEDFCLLVCNLCQVCLLDQTPCHWNTGWNLLQVVGSWTSSHLLSPEKWERFLK